MNEINIKRSGGQVSTESLWAFPLDNWNQRTEIFTKEIMLSTKEEKIMPLVEGKIKVYDNNNECIQESFNDEERYYTIEEWMEE